MPELTAGEDAERQQYGRNKADRGGWVKQTDNCSEEDKWKGREEEEASIEERERTGYNVPPVWQGAGGLLFSSTATMIMHVGAGLSGSGSCDSGSLSSSSEILVINEAGARFCAEEVDEE